MYGETLLEWSLSIARLAILSIHPILNPRNDITIPRMDICLLRGIKATQIGIQIVLINKNFTIFILNGNKNK
jgi:hypothetical protein